MRDGHTVTEGPHAQHSDPQRGGALLRDWDTGSMPWHRKRPCFEVTIKENSQLIPLTHLLTGRGAAGTPPGWGLASAMLCTPCPYSQGCREQGWAHSNFKYGPGGFPAPTHNLMSQLESTSGLQLPQGHRAGPCGPLLHCGCPPSSCGSRDFPGASRCYTAMLLRYRGLGASSHRGGASLGALAGPGAALQVRSQSLLTHAEHGWAANCTPVVEPVAPEAQLSGRLYLGLMPPCQHRPRWYPCRNPSNWASNYTLLQPCPKSPDPGHPQLTRTRSPASQPELPGTCSHWGTFLNKANPSRPG